jgi:hypothetical protein
MTNVIDTAWEEFKRQWAVDGMPADKQRLARAAYECGQSSNGHTSADIRKLPRNSAAWQKERSMSDIDQVILELKCLGEVAEIEGMTVEGNALHPIINMGWQSLERLRAEVASLKSDLESYMRIANDEANENVSLTQQLAAANGRVEMLAGWLRKYGNHYRGPGEMCELLKHSDYPCTCGLDAALSNLNEDSAG